MASGQLSGQWSEVRSARSVEAVRFRTKTIHAVSGGGGGAIEAAAVVVIAETELLKLKDKAMDQLMVLLMPGYE